MVRPPTIIRNPTGSEIEHFRQYGFVRLKQILPEDEVAHLQRAMSLALDTFELSRDKVDLTELADTADHYRAAPPAAAQRAGPMCDAALAECLRESGAHPLRDRPVARQPPGRSRLDFYASRRVPDLRKLALESDLPKIAAMLLDVRSVRFYQDVLCAKEPAAVERGAFHQDVSFLHVSGTRGVTFWMFIDPVRDGAGALGYVPSSQKWRQVFKPNFIISDIPCPGSEGAKLPPIDQAPEAFGVQYVEADPGDIVVHHALTVHGKQGNRSAHPCRGFALRYIDSAMRFQRRAGLALPSVYQTVPPDGSMLDDDLHPVAWSRPAGAR
jgi:hypothetical protein